MPVSARVADGFRMVCLVRRLGQVGPATNIVNRLLVRVRSRERPCRGVDYDT